MSSAALREDVLLVLGWTGGPPSNILGLVPVFRAAEVASAA